MSDSKDNLKSLIPDGLIVEFLKSEDQLKGHKMRRGLRQWRGLKSPKPPIGLYLIECEAWTVDRYVQAVSTIQVRVRPCRECQAPRYVPMKASQASACRKCRGVHTPEALPSAIGRELVFEDYRLTKTLGQGAMGVVYKAQYRPAGRIDALKVMLPRFKNARRSKRFERERSVMAKLRHRNIVGIHRAGEHAGLMFMGLEYVEGSDLKALRRDGPMEPRRTLKLISGIAQGLAAAHSQGIVHRDLKPANILVDKQETPRIADFGLALDLEDDQRITRVGAAVGTPYYMSPEQLGGIREEVGPHSDLYALGVILYRLITGEYPHEAPSIPELHEKVLSAEYHPLSQFADVSTELETLCQRLLDPSIRTRAQNAESVNEAVEWLLNPEGPAPELCRRHRGLQKVGLAAMLIALVGALYLGVFGNFSVTGNSAKGDPQVVAKKMQGFLKKSRDRVEKLLPRTAQNPRKCLDELKDLETKVKKLQAREPAIFKDQRGALELERINAAQALSRWFLAEAGGRKQALHQVAKLEFALGQLLHCEMRLSLAQVDGVEEQLARLLKTKLKASDRALCLHLSIRARRLTGRLSEALSFWQAHQSELPLTPSLRRELFAAALIEGQEDCANSLLTVSSQAPLDRVQRQALKAGMLARLRPYEAWGRLNELVLKSERSPSARWARARHMADMDWPELVFADLEPVLKAEWSELERLNIRLFKAQALFFDGRFQEAEQLCQELTSLSERWSPPLRSETLIESLERRRQWTRIRSRALMQHALITELKGQNERAGQLFQQAVDTDPSHAQAYVTLAQWTARRGHSQIADTQIEAGLKVQAMNPGMLLEKAIRLLEQKQAQAAEKFLTQAFARSRSVAEKADVLLALSRAVAAAGRRQEAELLAKRAVSWDRQPYVCRSLWRRLRAAGDKAVNMSDRELRQISAHLRLRRFPAALTAVKAMLAIKQDRYQEALTGAEHATDINSQCPEAYAVRALSRAQDQQYREAFADTQRAIQLGWSWAQVWHLQAVVAAQIQRPQQAMEAINEAIRRDPWQRRFYQLRADLQRRAGAGDQAKLDDERAASFQKDSLDKDFEEQVRAAFNDSRLETLNELVWRRPGRAETLFDYGRLLGSKSATPKELALSVLALTQCVYRRPRLEGPSLENINQLLSYGRRNFEEIFKQATRDQPYYLRNRSFTAGAIHLYQCISKKGFESKWVTAIKAFEETLDERPDHVTARAYQGLALGMNGYEQWGLDQIARSRLASRPFPGADFFQAVLLARQGQIQDSFQYLEKSDGRQRAAIIQGFANLFPIEMRRTERFKKYFNR